MHTYEAILTATKAQPSIKPEHAANIAQRAWEALADLADDGYAISDPTNEILDAADEFLRPLKTTPHDPHERHQP